MAEIRQRVQFVAFEAQLGSLVKVHHFVLDADPFAVLDFVVLAEVEHEDTVSVYLKQHWSYSLMSDLLAKGQL